MIRWIGACRRDERGLAVPVAVTGLFLLATIALVLGVLGQLLADQRRAATAADLAALAAATAIQVGEQPCEAAAESVSRNGARLRGCIVDGDRVRVEAVRPSTSVLGRDIEVTAEAHAGPTG